MLLHIRHSLFTPPKRPLASYMNPIHRCYKNIKRFRWSKREALEGERTTNPLIDHLSVSHYYWPGLFLWRVKGSPFYTAQNRINLKMCKPPCCVESQYLGTLSLICRKVKSSCFLYAIRISKIYLIDKIRYAQHTMLRLPKLKTYSIR